MDGWNITIAEARRLLDTYRQWHDARDAIVFYTYTAGVSKEEIHQRTGHGRGTIDAILATTPQTGPAAPLLPSRPDPHDNTEGL